MVFRPRRRDREDQGRERLGERQRRAFAGGEVGRLPPGRHREQPLVGLACLFGVPWPPSTQELHPVIWLARRWTSSRVVDGTGPFFADLSRARMACMASGMIIAGFFIRGCMVALQGSVTSGGFRRSLL
jgi:hypothetical protein